MKSIIFVIFYMTIACNIANASEIVSATCQNIKGRSAYIRNNDIKFEDDGISDITTFIFRYETKTVIDSQGNEYILLKQDNTLKAFTPDALVTFYPKEDKIIISKHTYWKDALPTSKIDISAYILIGDCKFQY